MSSIVFRGASFALRLGQLAFAAVIAGIVSTYIRHVSQDQLFSERFLYIIILASISTTLAVVWLLPFSHTFRYFPVDFLLSIAWFVAFGIFVMFTSTYAECDHNSFNWHDITDSGVCNQLKATQAFSFLSACFWFGGFLLGALFVFRERREKKRKLVNATRITGDGKA